MAHLVQFADHCRRHELAFPVDAEGRPFWRPSVRAADWRLAEGTGTVYSTTVVHRAGEEPYDVSLIELDEGVRLMSRVEGLAPGEVRIGMRVRVQWTGDDPPVPVFVRDDA